MKALLVVDVQKDFCPGGALPAPQGDKVVPVINKLMDKFEYVFASQDWHRPDSLHFVKWPVHCIKDTEGAKFHPLLRLDKIRHILRKGTSKRNNGYSAFEASNVNLKKLLKKYHIDEIYITGLTTEYCIRSSALDAVRHGLDTYVVTDAVEGVKQHKGDEEKAMEEMKHAGVKFIQSEEVN